MTGRPLRWLFFYDCIYPESLGGVEHRNYELARELGRLGHEVVLSGWAEAPHAPHPNVRVEPVAKASRRYLARGRRSGLEAMLLASQVRRIPLDGVDIVETANIPYLPPAPARPPLQAATHPSARHLARALGPVLAPAPASGATWSRHLAVLRPL